MIGNYLSAECILYMHPVVLNGVIAVNGFGEPASNVDQVVQGHGRDASLGNGNGGTEQPGISIRIVRLNLETRTGLSD